MMRSIARACGARRQGRDGNHRRAVPDAVGIYEVRIDIVYCVAEYVRTVLLLRVQYINSTYNTVQDARSTYTCVVVLFLVFFSLYVVYV